MWNLTIHVHSTKEIASFSLGMVRAVLLISYNIPTILKIIRNKDPNVVSKKSLILQYQLQLISLAYGVLAEELPMVVANVGSLGVLVTISILRCHHARTLTNPPDPLQEQKEEEENLPNLPNLPSIDVDKGLGIELELNGFELGQGDGANGQDVGV